MVSSIAHDWVLLKKREGSKEQNRTKLIIRLEDGERMSCQLVRKHTKVLHRPGPASTYLFVFLHGIRGKDLTVITTGPFSAHSYLTP